MEIFISALNLTAMYALVALGLSLAWAGIGFLNLAHGVTFLAAGYAAWWFGGNVSDNGILVLCAGIVAGALGGAIIWLVVFLPLDGRPNFEMRAIIATLALSFLGANVFLKAFGPGSKVVPPVYSGGSFRVFGTVVTADRASTIAVATVVLAAVVIAMNRTRLGLGIRALTQNPEGARLVGIDRKNAALAILSVSGGLVGAAAVMLSQTFFVTPNAGGVILIKGLVVALLGGFGSVAGTVLAAALVGAAEALTLAYLGGQYVLATLFVLILMVLLVRPRGIAGLLENTRA